MKESIDAGLRRVAEVLYDPNRLEELKILVKHEIQGED